MDRWADTGLPSRSSTIEDTSPWFPAGLVLELQDLLGRKVDVVSEDGLYWLLKPRILQEARPL